MTSRDREGYVWTTTYRQQLVVSQQQTLKQHLQTFKIVPCFPLDPSCMATNYFWLIQYHTLCCIHLYFEDPGRSRMNRDDMIFSHMIKTTVSTLHISIRSAMYLNKACCVRNKMSDGLLWTISRFPSFSLSLLVLTRSPSAVQTLSLPLSLSFSLPLPHMPSSSLFFSPSLSLYLSLSLWQCVSQAEWANKSFSPIEEAGSVGHV
jgi:hypothetical protein